MLDGILPLAALGMLSLGWYLLARFRRQLLRKNRALMRQISEGPIAKNAPYSAKDSALKLVKGIAFHNEMTLFLRNGKSQANENEQIILDLFSTLDIDPKIVNVSSDSDMHLGIPFKDGKADIPYLYIDGLPFGGAAEILASVSNGGLAEKLTTAKISFNLEVATQMARG